MQSHFIFPFPSPFATGLRDVSGVAGYWIRRLRRPQGPRVEDGREGGTVCFCMVLDPLSIADPLQVLHTIQYDTVQFTAAGD